MRSRIPGTVALFLSLAALADARHAASAQALVGDPFVSPYPSWVDAFPAPVRLGNWRASLHNPTLMDTNNANPPTTGGGTNTGRYEPDVLVQNNFVAPAVYDLNATLRTNDDDIIGLVWNYQDPDNYFRVGIRQQSGGSFGGTEGLAVQKVVGGVVTQLNPSTAVAGPVPITQSMIDNRTPFDLKVAVDGTNYDVLFNGTSLASGSDADLASGRKIGVMSWAQQSDVAAVTPYWGTEVENVSVTQGGNTLYSESFAARPVQWRPLVMTNAAGESSQTQGLSKELIGNFGVDVNDPWILQHSNGFRNATVANTDFIGPAVIVDEPGSAAMSDYDMRLRMGAADNDGMGVLVRVQDDNNFYRITFANEATDTAGVTRAPRGMSVQKVRNGVWSELYSDDDAPLFVFTPGTANTNPESGLPMFDLSVRLVENTLAIEVIDDLGNLIRYPLITDASDPLLTGTVGLHTWGTENVYYMSHGGTANPLVTVIPEPSAALLAVAALILGSSRGRRGRRDRI